MRHFPNSEAGKKLDVWAHYGSKKMLDQEGVIPEGRYDVWFTQPMSRSESGKPGGPSLSYAISKAPGGSVRVMREDAWSRLREEIGKNPTTGLCAISMALESKPEALLLIGFDALGPEDPYYHDNIPVPTGPNCSGKWRPGVHNMVKEKEIIRKLWGGEWFGHHVEAEILWATM